MFPAQQTAFHHQCLPNMLAGYFLLMKYCNDLFIYKLHGARAFYFAWFKKNLPLKLKHKAEMQNFLLRQSFVNI